MAPNRRGLPKLRSEWRGKIARSAPRKRTSNLDERAYRM